MQCYADLWSGIKSVTHLRVRVCTGRATCRLGLRPLAPVLRLAGFGACPATVRKLSTPKPGSRKPAQNVDRPWCGRYHITSLSLTIDYSLFTLYYIIAFLLLYYYYNMIWYFIIWYFHRREPRLKEVLATSPTWSEACTESSCCSSSSHPTPERSCSWPTRSAASWSSCACCPWWLGQQHMASCEWPASSKPSSPPSLCLCVPWTWLQHTSSEKLPSQVTPWWWYSSPFVSWEVSASKNSSWLSWESLVM